MQCQAWDELVEQVRKGEPAEEALGLEHKQENPSREEFWERLVVRGVGDTPLPFLAPDLGDLLEVVTPAPREELVVFPPCLCLDSVLQPEFVVPPAELLEQATHDRQEEEERVLGGRGSKRRREVTPDSSSSPTTAVDDNDIIDLTQE